MEKFSADIIVIGAGAAGMMAASSGTDNLIKTNVTDSR